MPALQPPLSGPKSSLLLRVVTGVVLIAVALGAVWQGGMVFSILVALGVLTMFAEWSVMFGFGRLLRLAGLAVLAAIVFLTASVAPTELVALLAAAAGLIGLFARKLQPRAAFWITAGLIYCGLPAIALLWLRAQPDGIAATIWVLALVWSTDIAAFFTGRAIGGPKLMPTISPNKTWAGAIGGVIAAALVGAGLARWYLRQGGSPVWLLTFAGIAAVLAILAVLGDLFESGLKRRAGVKDSGALLPGHGGVLDRLDGLVPVACAAALLFAYTGWAR